MKEGEKIIRKIDPSKKRDIQVITLKKVEEFLKEQSEPIFRSEIVRKIGVNYNSLNVALQMLPVRIDKEGKISINKSKKRPKKIKIPKKGFFKKILESLKPGELEGV